MAKIKAAVKKNQITVKSKLDKTEGINGRDIQVFQSKLIRGLMRPVVESERVITYTAPVGITLEKYLKGGITKNDFFIVLAQTIEMIKKVERNNFDVNNIVFDMQYVFINVMTKEVSFIYQPIINTNSKVNLFGFLYNVAETSVLSWQDEAIVVPKFVNFLRSMTYFSTMDIENYILREYPEVYKQVQRTKPGQSQVLNDKQWEADSGSMGRNGQQAVHQASVPQTQVQTTWQPSEPLNNRHYIPMDGSLNGTINPQFESAEEPATVLLVEDEEEQTTLLYEEEEQTTLLHDDDYEATTLLEPVIVKKPYLIRVNTQERADVTKDVFMVGKEQRSVDFYVSGNSAVSRQHAEIITRNECYFIKDNNSTNKSYVNDTVVPAGVEVEIQNGDKIVLANEPFEFYVEEV